MPKPVKLLALVLAGHADADGSRVRPGNDRLAAITGDSEKNVRRLIGVLRDDLGLVKVAKRGGGRWGTGRATEYQLTIPIDLIERVQLLDPDCTAPVLTGHQMSGQNEEPPAEEGIRTDTQTSAQKPESPVDNPIRTDTQMSGHKKPAPDENEFHRTSDAVTESMTGHPEPSDRTSRCPPTSHDQPPKETTSGHHPAQPQTAHEDDRTDDAPPKVGKCEHGLRLTLRADGTPGCPCCRRGIGVGIRLVQGDAPATDTAQQPDFQSSAPPGALDPTGETR